MPLTDLAVRQAKPSTAPFKLSDSGGLYLQVTPAGGKLWRLKYRIGGREKLLSFGAYPIVSLADARDERDLAKKELKKGLDPAEERRAKKRAATTAASQTFGLVAKELISRLEAEERAEQTIRKTRWMLEDLAAPLAQRPVSQIKPAEVLEVLKRVEAKGNHESANRCRATIGRVFRFAISTGRAEADPTMALAGALATPNVRHHAAITKSDGVAELLRAIEGLDGSVVVKSALQLMALCFPRPGELRLAEWADISFDNAIWLIPGERAKMRRPHKIPLATQAVVILKRLQTISGDGRLVFPGVRTPSRPLSENTLNAALRRLGYTTEEMTSHGFRTTASTLLNESGRWHPDAIERALAHQDANSIRRAYARGEYWDERVRMATWWADYLDELRTGRKPEPAPDNAKPAPVSKPKGRVRPNASRATQASEQLSLFDNP